jgi:hypothetical protein
MAKLNDDTQTVASRWPGDKDFAQRASEAAPDSLLRDIRNDALRGLAPRSALPSPKREYVQPPQAPIPTFREWAHARLGVDWTEARAKSWYDTERTAGRDVGSVRPQSASPGVPRRGWVEPPKVADWRAPGLEIMDRMMDQQDALDRAERERKLRGGGV